MGAQWRHLQNINHVKKNTNCLQGFRCPKCGSIEPFYIDVVTSVRMWDDGSDLGYGADLEWEDDSYCMCGECSHDGKVKDFNEDRLHRDNIRSGR